MGEKTETSEQRVIADLLLEAEGNLDNAIQRLNDAIAVYGYIGDKDTRRLLIVIAASLEAAHSQVGGLIQEEEWSR